MARKARRDCRKSLSKKNNMNVRVEALQKSIKKSKKEGSAASTAAASAPQTETLTPAAAAFLSQMREEVADGIERSRARVTKSSEK
jgi:CHASE3 domain sensor protein